MAFMEPDYTSEMYAVFHKETDTFHEGTYCEDRDICQSAWIDAMNVDPSDYQVRRVPGYFARLSAPGYLDCTDWYGPYKTLAEAKEHLSAIFDVDPDTGDDLED